MGQAGSYQNIPGSFNIRHSGITGQRYAIFPNQSGTNAGVGVSVGTNGIGVYEHGNGYLTPLLDYNFPSAVNTWIHGGCGLRGNTGDSESQLVRRPSLFINGTYIASGLTSQFGSNSVPSIGSDGPGGNNYGAWTGYLDNIRIWNGALTQLEIISVMPSVNGDYEQN